MKAARRCEKNRIVIPVHSSLREWRERNGHEWLDETDSCFSCLEPIIRVETPGGPDALPITITTYYIVEWS